MTKLTKKLLFKKILLAIVYFFSTIFILSFFSKPYNYRTTINKNYTFFIFIKDVFNFLCTECKIIRNLILKACIKIIKIYLIYKIILFINISVYDLIKDIFYSLYQTNSETPIVIFIPYTPTYKEYVDVSIDPFVYIKNHINYKLFFYDVAKKFPIFFYFILNFFFNIYIFIAFYFYTKTFLSIIKSFWFYYYIFFFVILKTPIWFTNILTLNRELWCFTASIFIFIYLFLILYFFKKPWNILNKDTMFIGELNKTAIEIKGPFLIYLGSIYLLLFIFITLSLYLTNNLPLTDKDIISSIKLDPYFIPPTKK